MHFGAAAAMSSSPVRPAAERVEHLGSSLSSCVYLSAAVAGLTQKMNGTDWSELWKDREEAAEKNVPPLFPLLRIGLSLALFASSFFLYREEVSFATGRTCFKRKKHRRK